MVKRGFNWKRTQVVFESTANVLFFMMGGREKTIYYSIHLIICVFVILFV